MIKTRRRVPVADGQTNGLYDWLEIRFAESTGKVIGKKCCCNENGAGRYVERLFAYKAISWECLLPQKEKNTSS